MTGTLIEKAETQAASDLRMNTDAIDRHDPRLDRSSPMFDCELWNAVQEEEGRKEEAKRLNELEALVTLLIRQVAQVADTLYSLRHPFTTTDGHRLGTVNGRSPGTRLRFALRELKRLAQEGRRHAQGLDY